MNLNHTIILTGLLTYVGVMLKNLPSRLFTLIQKRLSSSITVTSDNIDQWIKINKYILDLNKPQFSNNIESNNEGPMIFTSIGDGVYVYRPSLLSIAIVNKINLDSKNRITKEISITVYGCNRRNIIDEINKYLLKKMDDGKISIITPTGSYRNGSSRIYKRSIDSLFISDKELLISKIDKFINDKKFYIEHGIPYKMGILLHGEPGCGKSTISKVIASYLDYKIYNISNSAFINDEVLTQILGGIEPNSIIVFDDIDCVVTNRDDENNNNSTLGTLLNFLDGLLSVDDTIIIATTNHFDRLDSAIVRPGRFDLIMELGKLDYDMAKQMCDSFGVDIDSLDIELPINPSKLQNILLLNRK